MNDLLAAELRKVRTVRSSWVLASAAVALCILWTVVSVLTLDGQAALSQEQRIQNVYQMAQQPYLFVLILGIVITAGEHRHGTVTWAFLISPRRERVVAAKLVAAALVATVIGVAAVICTGVVAASLLAATGRSVFVAGMSTIAAGSILSTVLYACLGVGLGALLRNQVAGIIAAVVWFWYAEYLLGWLVPDVGRWLPGGAAQAVSGANPVGGGLLPAWAGGLLLFAYATALALAATESVVRRDIT